MSEQLSLDLLLSIDWERPKLDQIEQLAIGMLPSTADVATAFVERHGTCVVVSERGVVLAWMKPWLVRTDADALEWVVLLKQVGTRGYAQIRGDEEVESALAVLGGATRCGS